MLHRLSLKQQFFIVTSLLLLGCICMALFIVYPSIRNMNNIGNNIHSLQAELEADYTETQAMRRTLREIDTVDAEIQRYKEMALAIGDELAVITELERLATEHTLSQSLSAAYHANDDPAVGLPYYTFSVVLSGTFDDIFSYIQTIEAKHYYVLIDSLELTQTSNAQTSLRFDARIYVQHN